MSSKKKSVKKSDAVTDKYAKGGLVTNVTNAYVRPPASSKRRPLYCGNGWLDDFQWDLQRKVADAAVQQRQKRFESVEEVEFKDQAARELAKAHKVVRAALQEALDHNFDGSGTLEKVERESESNGDRLRVTVGFSGPKYPESGHPAEIHTRKYLVTIEEEKTNILALGRFWNI